VFGGDTYNVRYDDALGTPLMLCSMSDTSSNRATFVGTGVSRIHSDSVIIWPTSRANSAWSNENAIASAIFLRS
jgi:hypothetical protein